MNSTAALLPVILIISCGYLAARIGWIRSEHLPGLANVVFLVLNPALMFRTMSHVGFSGMDYFPIAVYLAAALAIYVGVSVFLGRTQRAYVIGLACVFSNHVMIGIPLISLAYGTQGLAILIALISIHALTLLSVATLMLEWRKARDEMAQDHLSAEGHRAGSYRYVLKVVGRTAYRAIVHPVIFPIALGLIWNWLGLPLPGPVDKALMTMGQANGAMSLVLVGATLAHTRIKGEFLGAFKVSLVKNVAMPVLIFSMGWLLGVRGLPLAVITVAAGLPTGNNAYLFSHRYGHAQALVTASMAMATVVSIFTLALSMFFVGRYVL